MDWTGGTRRRFAGAKNNNAALQRQKAHFARARAAVQHEPFSSHQRAKAVDHNDDTRVISYKGSGRDAVASGRDDHTRTSTRQSWAANSAEDANPHQDEELRLLASRRKLLARNDWLALGHTRPLRIGFPAAGDKDRVGRRRKIKKSPNARTQAAQRRLVTPLFEERLEPTAYLMSGALPPDHDDHVEVRVGTSAFETQSRPSRKSNTSRNASMGAHSTALSHLSEESMLLGADGDSFDADQVEVPEYTRDVRDALEGMVRPVSSDIRQYELEEVDRYSSRMREYSLALDDDPELQQHRAGSFDEDSPSISFPHHFAEPTTGSPLIDNYAALGSQAWNAGDPQHANDFENLDRNMLVDASDTAIPPDQRSIGFDAEQGWRNLMGIVTQSGSFTSMKALGSSSEHNTTSESMQRIVPGDPQQGAAIHDSVPEPEEFISTSIQSHPTKALDTLATGTQPPPRLPEDAEDHTDNEALWREFIIGSQDSESGDELHSAWQRSRERMRQSSEQPQSVQVSGLGTSDQATRGEATIYSPNALATQVANVDDSLKHDTESIEEFPLDDIPRYIGEEARPQTFQDARGQREKYYTKGQPAACCTAALQFTSFQDQSEKSLICCK